MQAYARGLTDQPELADLVAGEANGEEGMEIDTGAGRSVKRKRIYEDHRPMSSITAGIKAGTLHQVLHPGHQYTGGLNLLFLSFFWACLPCVSSEQLCSCAVLCVFPPGW